jgi:hypothetical protein
MDNYHAVELTKTLRSIDERLGEIVDALGLLASPEKPS